MIFSRARLRQFVAPTEREVDRINRVGQLLVYR